MGSELDLESTHTGASTARGANLSGEVWERCDVSLPSKADVLVSCVPRSCIPSPESPTRRTVIPLTVSTFLPSLNGEEMILETFTWIRLES